MQDRPTAVELLRAAQDFIEKDLQPALTGRVRFHARVLQNVLGILEREWSGEEAAVRKEWTRLQGLLGNDAGSQPADLDSLHEAVRANNVELSARIRQGVFDDRFGELIEALRPTVADKLAIANPRWAASPSRGP